MDMIKRQEGMALVLTLIVVIIMAGFVSLIMLEVGGTNKKEVNFAYNHVLVEEAAQAGVDLAIATLWNELSGEQWQYHRQLGLLSLLSRQRIGDS